ncbi:MAG: DNA cytosine methyltransferase [Mesosutterella sp.]|nr:DNA cytosine methyltransferase [Mesosutterella sp.]
MYKFRNNSEFLKEKSELRVSDRVRKRLEYIPEGKNIWNVQDKLPLELRLKVKTSTLSQIYRWLNRAKPAYTITGSGGGGTYVYHWEEPRPLTNFEKARLQTFPVYFKFHGNKTSVKKQIGMAVPCIGAEKILTALLLRFAGKSYKSVEPEGVGLEGYFPSLKQN